MTSRSEPTVRSLVTEIQIELRSGDVEPARAREMLMTLTSLFGNCSTELTRAEGAYTAVLAKSLDEEKKANRARIRAELSAEFAARQEAKNVLALVTELIRSLKIVLKSVEEEMRLAR